MRVLLSIKPEFALRIFDGSKKYEYRRVIFQRADVKTAIVYASDPIKKVIGEFEIGEILCEQPQALWAKTGDYAGITKERFLGYFEKRGKGYAIRIREARMYDTPIPLSKLTVLSPPQSFAYL
jgi:predicted transcriptional regulator